MSLRKNRNVIVNAVGSSYMVSRQNAIKIAVVGDVLAIRICDVMFTKEVWNAAIEEMNALLRSQPDRDFDAVVDISACAFLPMDVVSRMLTYLRSKWDILNAHLRSWVLITSSPTVRCIVESTSAVLCEKRFQPRTLSVPGRNDDERSPHCSIGLAAWTNALHMLHM